MQMLRSLIFVGLFAAAGCQARPVSVVTPEHNRDVPDLAPISTVGDTSWRVSAREDLATHSSAAPAALPQPATIRRAAPAVGFASISPATVNDEPTATLLGDDEGPAVLRSQVLLDRAHFSSGLLNGKAGQNLSKAVYFFQEENGLP